MFTAHGARRCYGYKTHDAGTMHYAGTSYTMLAHYACAQSTEALKCADRMARRVTDRIAEPRRGAQAAGRSAHGHGRLTRRKLKHQDLT